MVAMRLPACAFWSWRPSWRPRSPPGAPGSTKPRPCLPCAWPPGAWPAFLNAHPDELRQGARGQGNDQVPTVEDVEDQYQRIIALSDENARPERLVRELGTLAHQVQLLLDPSAVRGSHAPAGHLRSLRRPEPAQADPEPGALLGGDRAPGAAPPLLRWAKTKYERHQALLDCFDEKAGRRVGAWDDLSVPFAQLQLSYSNGINATANIWIQLYRAVGDRWD